MKISGSGSNWMQRAVRLLASLALLLVLELAELEGRLDELALAKAADQELLRQRIDRLGADAVQADAELEYVVVVLGAGVDLRHAVHDLAQRDAAPEIAHRHALALDLDLDLLAVAHDEFINRVVYDLLEQDVAAVIVVGAVADAADVHARAQPDVLQGGQRLDLALVVNVLCVFSHDSMAFRIRKIRGEANRK